MTAPMVLTGPITGEWFAAWRILVSMGITAVQLAPAQIKAFAFSMGKRAKTDQIDAELIARFMVVRPEASRTLPDEKLQLLQALTVRRAQMVDARKRLSTQISAPRKQVVSAELEDMDSSFKAFLECQISEFEHRIQSVIAEATEFFAKAELLRSIPGIGPVSAAMLLAEMPEPGRMTATEAAARVYRLALEHGVTEPVYHAVADEAVPFRKIAEVIGRRVGLPSESRDREHFGWFGAMAAADMAASAARTRALLGWMPTGPSLLSDLDQPGYYT